MITEPVEGISTLMAATSKVTTGAAAGHEAVTAELRVAELSGAVGSVLVGGAAVGDDSAGGSGVPTYGVSPPVLVRK